MRILILANRDLASNFALNYLLPELRSHDIKICLSDGVGHGGKKPADLQLLKFFEQSLFNDILFPAMSSGTAGNMSCFDGLGAMTGRPIESENKINSPESLQRIERFSPDLILSIRFGGILKDQVIAIPRHGVLNLHSGQLPAYRGVMATFWAMLNGDSEIGTTLHYISDGTIDTGAIVHTSAISLNSDKSYLWNILALYRGGCARIVDAVGSIGSGSLLIEQPQSGVGDYYSFPSEDDVEAFRGKGFRLFDPEEIVDIAKNYF